VLSCPVSARSSGGTPTKVPSFLASVPIPSVASISDQHWANRTVRLNALSALAHPVSNMRLPRASAVISVLYPRSDEILALLENIVRVTTMPTLSRARPARVRGRGGVEHRVAHEEKVAASCAAAARTPAALRSAACRRLAARCRPISGCKPLVRDCGPRSPPRCIESKPALATLFCRGIWHVSRLTASISVGPHCGLAP